MVNIITWPSFDTDKQKR